ncbi:hypothetical protein [Pseudofrankia inefficax]|nr:hypothetical protein [Pseudofrankia inefficax]
MLLPAPAFAANPNLSSSYSQGGWNCTLQAFVPGFPISGYVFANAGLSCPGAPAGVTATVDVQLKKENIDSSGNYTGTWSTLASETNQPVSNGQHLVDVGWNCDGLQGGTGHFKTTVNVNSGNIGTYSDNLVSSCRYF